MATAALAAIPRPDRVTLAVLAVCLIAYPLLYCAGFVDDLVRPIFSGSRAHRWMFWGALLAFHWAPFGLVAWDLRRKGEAWPSIGVDWGAFQRQRHWCYAVLALLVAAAFVMPGVHYPDGPPKISPTIFLVGMTTPERLLIIFAAITAGVTEEAIFRGYALTRLGRWFGSAWWALPVSAVSFLFIHGVPRDEWMLVNYTLAGLAFGVPFILMKLKRLELLIAIHFAIDASMVFAP